MIIINRGFIRNKLEGEESIKSRIGKTAYCSRVSTEFNISTLLSFGMLMECSLLEWQNEAELSCYRGEP